MPRCPTCAQLLLDGDQPCPRCRPPGVSFDGGGYLERILSADPLLAEGMELVERLEEIAPAVARWRNLRRDGEAAGPQPDVHPQHREEVDRILKRMGEIAREVDARKG